jgi:hypothetical protein
VISSTIRILGCCRRVRAKASLFFSPPESLAPSGPSDSSKPLGSRRRTWSSCVSAATSSRLLDSSTAIETVKVWVQAGGKPSASLTFNTGVASAGCLETVGTGQCALLWEVETTTATGSSSQSNNNTTPNIIVKLDYQWHPGSLQKSVDDFSLEQLAKKRDILRSV